MIGSTSAVRGLTAGAQSIFKDYLTKGRPYLMCSLLEFGLLKNPHNFVHSFDVVYSVLPTFLFSISNYASKQLHVFATMVFHQLIDFV